MIEGGAGNDTLYGNATLTHSNANGEPVAPHWVPGIASYNGSDTYLFGRGDGQDTIIDNDYGVNQTDVLRFKPGVAAQDLDLAQRGSDLVVTIRGTTDSVTIKGFLFGTPTVNPFETRAYGTIERFEFADGAAWDVEQIVAAAWTGTVQVDVFIGNGDANRMAGLDGNTNTTSATQAVKNINFTTNFVFPLLLTTKKGSSMNI